MVLKPKVKILKKSQNVKKSTLPLIDNIQSNPILEAQDIIELNHTSKNTVYENINDSIIILRNNDDKIIKITNDNNIKIIKLDEVNKNQEEIKLLTYEKSQNNNIKLLLNNKILTVEDADIRKEIHDAVQTTINNETSTENYFTNFIQMIKDFGETDKEIIFIPLDFIINVEKNSIKKNKLNQVDIDSIFNTESIIEKIQSMVNNFKDHVPNRYVFIPIKLVLSVSENTLEDLI